MVEPLGIGTREIELKLGASFGQGNDVGFHSIRYDFKPASVDTKKMASLNITDGKSVQVTVPHVEGCGKSGPTHTVYKGNKRPIQKECVLIIDQQTGEITLEKLSTTIQLKKTRIEGSSKASQQAARPLTPSELVKQTKTSPSKKSKKSSQESQAKATSQKKEAVSAAAPVVPQPEASPVLSGSESESGEASSDSSDEDVPMTKPSPQLEVPLNMPTFGATQPQQPPAPGRNRFTSMLSEDLRLSESGSDSD